jgi:hypothetical protein
MSSPPPVTPTKSRDWTLPLIGGVVAVVLLVLAVCVVGGAAAFVALRRDAAPSPSARLAPSAVPAPPPADTGTGPDCLIGAWLLTNSTSTAVIYGTTVQLSGKGTIISFAGDGTYVWHAENVVLSGTAAGDFYEVIFNSTIKLNYIADAEKILYSNPTATGMTTWKINGKVRTTEPTTSLLDPSTYKCRGNELRVFYENGPSEYQRILPPGVPV